MRRKLRFHGRESSHLARSVLLEESGSPLIIRLVILFGSMVVVAFIIWAIKTNIEEVAIADGEILPSGQIQKVQHLTGGQVTKVFIKEGALVKQGEPLMELDVLLTESQAEQSRSKTNLLLIQKARLEAIVNDKIPDFSIFEDQAQMQIQQQLFDQLQSYKQTRKEVLESQIKQLTSGLQELDEEEKMLLAQKKTLETEVELQKELATRKLAAISTVFEAQRDMSENQGKLAQLPIKRTKMLESIKEVEKRLIELDLQISEQTLKELADVQGELAQQEEILKRQEETTRQGIIRAPTNGIVHGLQGYASGSVIAPGATVLEIVPQGESLKAEIKISSRDIGHVQIGQSIVLKFTTYDFARYGGLSGKLEEVSATTFFDPTGKPYYRGSVTIHQNYLGANPQRNPILPGMTVQADIKTGEKTVMEYLLKPVFTSVQEALRER